MGRRGTPAFERELVGGSVDVAGLRWIPSLLEGVRPTRLCRQWYRVRVEWTQSDGTARSMEGLYEGRAPASSFAWLRTVSRNERMGFRDTEM